MNCRSYGVTKEKKLFPKKKFIILADPSLIGSLFMEREKSPLSDNNNNNKRHVGFKQDHRHHLLVKMKYSNCATFSGGDDEDDVEVEMESIRSRFRVSGLR